MRREGGSPQPQLHLEVLASWAAEGSAVMKCALSPSLRAAVGSYRIKGRKFGVGFLSEQNLPL